MIFEANLLHGMTVQAINGEVGRVDEILFDDKHWTVRYLVVDTGTWLSSRKVLISPMAFGHLDMESNTLGVSLTRDQIEKSPDVNTDEPVSRQWETEYYGYYGWANYWGGMGALGSMSGVGLGGWGNYSYPRELLAQPYSDSPEQIAAERANSHADSSLRSTREVTGYGVSATDGHIGHIKDFIVDDETWKIRYMAVGTSDWWPGKKVLLPPDWIINLNWPEGTVTVTVTREQVMNAPEWDHKKPIDRAFEDELYHYYMRERPYDMPTPKRDDTADTVAVF